MPVPTQISDLSTTAASNYPAGTDSPATLDDVQRAHAAFIAQLATGVTAHDATSKTTPVDADELSLIDSAATYGLKKLTWANLKATLATWLETLTATWSNKTFVAPVLGAATATSVNKVALTAPATGSTLTIADGKTLTVSNTLTLSGTDGSTLAIGAGGTLGSAAYTASTAYDAAGAAAAVTPTSLGLVIGTNVQAYDADLTTWAGVTPGTGVATALGVNVGSAGAVVVNGGAGAFSTLSSTGSTTLGDAATDTLNVGAGGLIKDAAGMIGIGVTPSAWYTGADAKALQLSSYGAFMGTASNIRMTGNVFYNSIGGAVYLTTAAATEYSQAAGVHTWRYAASGTAGTGIAGGTYAWTDLASLSSTAFNTTVPITSSATATINTSGTAAGLSGTPNISVGTVTASGNITTTASITGGALGSTGATNVFGTGTAGGCSIRLGPTTPTSNDSGNIEFRNSNAVKNWKIGFNLAVGDRFEILPSTAAGGSSYSAAALSVDSAGVVYASGASITGLLDLSAATSGQIKFPATQNASSDANTLDDYEEGTWTASDASGAGITVTTNACTYCKIGREVFIECYATYASTVDTSDAKLGGFPFTISAYGTAIVRSPIAATIPYISFDPSGTVGSFRTTGAAAVPNGQFSNQYVIFSGHYKV